MTNNKEVNYHLWNDEPIKANYYADVDLPNGGKTRSIIGQVTIEKGDAISLDYGNSLLEYTRSGKAPKAEFPFGKVTLHGTPAVIVLQESKTIQFTKSTEQVLKDLIKLQKERIDNFIPEMKENFILKHMEKIEQQNLSKIAQQKQGKVAVNNALSKMEAYFNKPKS